MDPLRKTLEYVKEHAEFVSLHAIPGVRIDLKYASTDNFMGRDVYGAFKEAFLHREAGAMLGRAVALLQQELPGAQLLVYDALRPRSVQRVLYSFVEGTPQESYVANPDRGSMHNYGCAIDLTVQGPEGNPLDMGTAFDAFDPLSEPKREEQYLAEGKLGREQHRNRLLLRRAMTGAGFIQLPHEWWHYDAFPGDYVRSNFTIVE